MFFESLYNNLDNIDFGVFAPNFHPEDTSQPAECTNSVNNWTNKQVKEVERIHSNLVIELVDEADNAKEETVTQGLLSEQALEDQLSKCTVRWLCFIAIEDLRLEINPSGRWKRAKQDFAKALVQWASPLLYNHLCLH
jgi:hypothetical protein